MKIRFDARLFGTLEQVNRCFKRPFSSPYLMKEGIKAHLGEMPSIVASNLLLRAC